MFVFMRHTYRSWVKFGTAGEVCGEKERGGKRRGGGGGGEEEEEKRIERRRRVRKCREGRRGKGSKNAITTLAARNSSGMVISRVVNRRRAS